MSVVSYRLQLFFTFYFSCCVFTLRFIFPIMLSSHPYFLFWPLFFHYLSFFLVSHSFLWITGFLSNHNIAFTNAGCFWFSLQKFRREWVPSQRHWIPSISACLKLFVPFSVEDQMARVVLLASSILAMRFWRHTLITQMSGHIEALI